MTTSIKERPIVFQPEMVRAILEGRKTQTRRLIDPQPNNPEMFGVSPVWGWGVPQGMDRFCVHAAFNEKGRRVDRHLPCRYGQPGDRLWVRESWRCNHIGGIRIEYRAGGKCLEYDEWPENTMPPYALPTSVIQVRRTERQLDGEKIADAWRPSIHMPRWASRLLLEITRIRVQRLPEITREEALAEGHEDFFHGCYFHDYLAFPATVANFRRAWDAAPRCRPGHHWGDAPWVWVIEFCVIES